MTPELQQFLMRVGSVSLAESANLQISEGAWYRTENGAVIGPAVHDPDGQGGVFNWRIGEHYFSDDGHWDQSDASSGFCLVAQIEPTPDERAALPTVLDLMLETARAEARRWWQGFTPLTVKPGRYRFGWTAANGQRHVRNVRVTKHDGCLWMLFADERFEPYANSAELRVSLLPDGCAFLTG